MPVIHPSAVGFTALQRSDVITFQDKRHTFNPVAGQGCSRWNFELTLEFWGLYVRTDVHLLA